MTKVYRGHQLFMFRPFVLGQAFMRLAIHVFTITRMIRPILSSLISSSFLIPGVHTLPTFTPLKTFAALRASSPSQIGKILPTKSKLLGVHWT
jgi:hypothetical protein